MDRISLPWWAKIGAKIVLSRIPFGYAVWQRLGIFRHGLMDSSEYAIRVFDSHIHRAGITDSLPGKTILELGPGDSISTAIIARAHKCRAILVDAGSFVRSDIVPYLRLSDALADMRLVAPNLSGCRDVTGVLDHCEARYLTAGLSSLRHLETASVDFIFSQAVLEHIRGSEFLDTMKECRRILKPNGICSHQIDLRDHLGGKLNNLRLDSKIWESDLFFSSGFYTNRIRFGRMLELIKQAGFHAEVSGVVRWPQLPTRRGSLAAEFQDLTDGELCISQFDAVLKQRP